MLRELYVTFVTGVDQSGKSSLARMLYEAALVAQHDQNPVLWFDEDARPRHFIVSNAIPIRHMHDRLGKLKHSATVILSSGDDSHFRDLVAPFRGKTKIVTRRITMHKEENW